MFDLKKPNFGKHLVYELLQYKPEAKPLAEVVTSSSSSSSIFGGCGNINSSKCGVTSDPTTTYDTSLLQYLFSLFMFKESRLQACQLVESILLHIPMLNLNRIANLRYILEAIDDDGLSCVCKIFAVTLSNLDMSERKYFGASVANTAAASVSSQNALRRSQQQQQHSQMTISENSTTGRQQQQLIDSDGKPLVSCGVLTSGVTQSSPAAQPQPLSIRDQNQEFLLSIPCLLFRLVNLVRRKDYTIRFNGASSEIENWIR